MPVVVSPLPQKTDVLDNIRPKLEEKTTRFQLKKESRLIQQTYAASDADNARAYAVIDLDTGEIIAEKNGSQRVPIASLTKIMTAVVALDLAKPTDLFTVTDRAANMIPTKIVLQPGERLTLEELLHASLLTSANDATEEIRDGVDALYPEPVFINAMNEKASFLGLANSHFANPQGFDSSGNYSSAEDLAVLAQYALTNYPLIASIVKKDYQFLPANENHRNFDLYNWNGLLDVYPDIEGVKIGNTSDAGMTTVVLSNRNGKKIAAVVLGAPGIIQRDLWAAELLDIGYEKELGLNPVNVTEDQLREKYSTWRYGS